MKRRINIPKVPLAISSITVVIIFFGALLLTRSEANVNQVTLASEPKGVTVATARETTYRPERRYIGTLEPWVSAKLGPQLVSAIVDTVLVRPGAVVKKRDVLATLDCRNASTASAAIGHQAEALAERQKGIAKENARLSELLEGGYVAANEYEQKRAQADSSEAQLRAVLAQSAGKALEVGDCVLRAPFDGEVSARFVDPGSFARPGSSIVEVVDRSVIRLVVDVPEIDFPSVPPKTPVTITLLATGQSLAGEITRRAPSADPSSRTVRVEIDLPNHDRLIPVGTTAEVHVNVGEPRPAIEIPLLAAKVRGKNATVFVIEDGVAKKAVFEVMGERGGSLFVMPSLKPGSLVVTQGRSLLADKDKVAAKLEDAVAKGAEQ
jgi:RND family efflux transporter MFP subunit